jgi:hypothetical protein
MSFFEVSCKEDINIGEAFLALARRIREQRNRRVSKFSYAGLCVWCPSHPHSQFGDLRTSVPNILHVLSFQLSIFSV